MKKLSILLLTLLFLLSGLIWSLPGDTTRAAAAEESFSALFLRGASLFSGVAYDFTIASKRGSSSGKMWMASPKIRIDFTANNRKMSSILDSQNQSMYTYFPDENRAMKLTYNPNNLPIKSAEAYIKDIAPEKIKELPGETYDGVWCRVFIRQDDRYNNLLSKMWIREDYGLPAKVEVTETDGTLTVVEYRNFVVGPLSPETFILPPGVKVTDMSGILNRLIH
ncbi:MAG TPA: hypothetical protein VN611_12020 [Patescibacteria group bacterium]|nr:hypothetical protein [Patescibacteria group bacterium]